MSRNIGYLILFMIAFGAIWGVQIQNRTEADDAYEYAWQAERGGPDYVYHSHHLIYGALAKDIYSGLVRLGYSGRAHGVLRLISALCGAGAILYLYLICRRYLLINPIGSMLAGASLLFSYGFWRYSNEAEIIAPASLMALMAVYLALRPNPSKIDIVVVAIVAGLAVLIHVMNIVPAFVAVPLILIARRNRRRLPLYLSISAALVLLAYGAIYRFEADALLLATSPSPTLSLVSIPKAAAGFLQNLVSGNFMLGIESFREALTKLFPARMLNEELLLGEMMPRWIPVLGMVTAILTAAAIASSIYLALRTRRINPAEQQETRPPETRAAIYGAAVWCTAYAAIILIIEPGNPEVWTMAMPALAILFAALIIAPLARAPCLWPILLTVLMLFIHNLLAGMLPLMNTAGDYNQMKSRWLIGNTRTNDLILTAGNPVFERHLRYHSITPVGYLYRWPDDQLRKPAPALRAIAQQLDRGGRIIMTGDIFDQPQSLQQRFPQKTAAIDIFAAKTARYVRKIQSDRFGGIYLLGINYENQ